MKTSLRFHLLIYFLIISPTLYSQWKPLNPSDSFEWYRSMYFTDDEHGWICGYNGMLLKFNAEDFLWERLPRITDKHLYSIGFFDNMTGISCGESGTLIRTSDGGESWIKLEFDSTIRLKQIQIFDKNTAYLVGHSGTLLKSVDKGLTWKPIPQSVNRSFSSVYFIDELHGCTGTDSSQILTTFDGGSTWLLKNIPFNYTHYFVSKIQFVDSMTGFAGGGGANQSGAFFLKTNDGGITWQTEAPMGTVFDMNLVDENWGIIAGGEGSWNKYLYLKSLQGYFIKISKYEGYNISCCWITPSGRGWAAGMGGTIYYAEDFRSDWKPMFAGKVYTPTRIGAGQNTFLISASYYEYEAPYNVILRGTSDKVLPQYIRHSELDFVNSINIPGPNTAFYSGHVQYICKSSDLGLTWNCTLYPMIGGRTFFLNDSTGWFYSANYGEGRIYKTTDGGSTWFEQLYPSPLIHLNEIFFINSDVGYALGQTVLLKTTNGGTNWFQLIIPNGIYNAVNFYNDDVGVIAGMNNVLFITFDGGVNWSQLNTGIQGKYWDAIFAGNNIFAAADEGYIFRSEDFGNTWTTYSIGTPVRELAFDGTRNLLARTNRNVYIYKFSEPLSVELVSFSGMYKNNSILLTWTTSTETNNSGFEVERKDAGEVWSTIGFVNGAGTISQQKEYFFTDESPRPGKYYYRLKQIDFSGVFDYSEVIEVNAEVLPAEYSVEQNYPNPFNPNTSIKYSIPEQTLVKIVIYDALGSEVRTILNEEKQPGIYSADFKAADLSSGIYYYRLSAGEFTKTKKMILLR